MTKTETLTKYELVLIFDSKITGPERDAIVKEAAEAVTKGGGKVINSQVWLEKQRLTFSIKKCNEGAYHLINFESGTDAVEKIKSALKLNEKILRFAVIKAE